MEYLDSHAPKGSYVSLIADVPLVQAIRL
ncbi:hypothetical protein [Paenibacillus sp. A51L]